MPVRATKRGAERTRFAPGASYDVLICGASFAGLAVARELRASGAKVLVLDRYEIGERQTSACAAPTEWLANLGLERSHPADLWLAARPHAVADRPLAASVDVLDVRLPHAVRAAVGAERRRRVRDREGRRAHRQRRPHRPRGRDRAADRRRARLAPGAGRGRERAAARRAALARAGGPSGRPRCRPRAVARHALHLARLRLVVPGARRAADRRRLVRPAACTSRTRRCAWPRTSRPTPCASRATGSRTACATPSATACSSSATRPATACR